jgi:hypothetical protein
VVSEEMDALMTRIEALPGVVQAFWHSRAED